MPNKFTRFINIGDKFDRVEVVEIVSSERVKVKCKCDPDCIYEISKYGLLNSNTKSCGCLVREKIVERNTTHGLSKLPLYSIYNGMVHRCYHELHRGYKYYGQKGIRICQDWNPCLLGWEEGFYNFKNWADRNGYEEGLSLDRVDSDNDYCPNNCMWIALKDNNGKTSKRKFHTINGVTKTTMDWYRDPICVVSDSMVRIRMKNGMTFEEAIITPKNSYYKKTT